MEKERSHVTKRILNLTLEIIYLLTGEDYGPIKKLSNPLRPPSLVFKNGRNRKILEVTQKIIKLLTGEEQEHLQGHKDLYKDVMMEKRPSLTSPDGSRSRNTPERCPRPLYSRDTMQEHQEIPQEDQKEECGIEDGGEKTNTTDEKGELPSKTQDKGCSPLYSGDLEGETLLDIKVEVKEEDEEETYVEELGKEDDVPLEISTDGSRSRNTPERSPRPLYSRDSTQEDQEIPQEGQEEKAAKDKEEETYIRENEQSEEEEIPADGCSSPLYSEDLPEGYKILQDYQGETLMDVKVKIKEEEEEDLCVSGNEPFKEKEVPGKMSTGGPRRRNRRSSFSPRGVSEDDDLLGYPQGTNSMALYLQPGPHMTDLSSDPSIHEGSFPGQSHPIDYHTGDHMFPFSEHRERFIKVEGTYSHSNYGKSFIQNCLLQRHQSNHTWGNPYACSECGKSFKLKSAFLRHKRTHTEERPFSCTECGKSFTQRAHLVSHERIHTGVKPYCCSECGKCFSHKISLITHESFHTGVKPFFCSECGKQFSRKSVLILHERVHTGEKPYPCPECGKCFSQRTHLNTHRRSHTSERPFSCSECGKTYSRKSYLVDHLRTHTGVKPYACTVCGKCFSCKSNLITHQTIHSSKKPFSCVECGKCFQTRSAFTYHKKLHAADKIPLC